MKLVFYIVIIAVLVMLFGATPLRWISSAFDWLSTAFSWLATIIGFTGIGGIL